MKKQNGITMIALIVTIIVILILAGVTITTLTGDNGLITKVMKTKEANKDADIIENIQLAYMEYKLENPDIELKDFIQQSLGKIYGIENVNTKNMGKNCKIDMDFSNKIYILKSDGNIKEFDKIERIPNTNVYGKLNDKELTLRATKLDGYATNRLGCSKG